MRVFNLFFRKLRFLNKLSLAIGLGISFGLCLLGNFQLHSQRTLAGKQNSIIDLDVCIGEIGGRARTSEEMDGTLPRIASFENT